jgi:hypothetical protein
MISADKIDLANSFSGARSGPLRSQDSIPWVARSLIIALSQRQAFSGDTRHLHPPFSGQHERDGDAVDRG